MTETPIERQTLEADIVCVGFGPAMGGFLTKLARELLDPDGEPKYPSRVAPGLPLQVLCYERAEDIGFGVSGVVTRARGIRGSFPDLDPSAIPMAAPVSREKLVYLLDPTGASRRARTLRLADEMIRGLDGRLHALELPLIPAFLRKEGGFVCSIGQFNQWVGQRLMGTGLVQIWPGTPVTEALSEDGRVAGVRLLDQGTDRAGHPDAGFLPGMEVRAGLTVVGDGPVGPIGRQLNDRFGMPAGRSQRDWAVGVKMVIELSDHVELEPGTVFHTFGFPEPESFGFLYAHPDRLVSAGIFVPSWFDSPVRTSYRYLQHFIQHPYLWRYLEGGTLRSWGAKSIQESGKQGEPWLVGDGYARIGEGSGSTNVLTGSGVDEAWTTGVLLAEGVLELVAQEEPFTRANLERTYVARRRNSWVEAEGRIAEKARNGFQRGMVTGLVGMAIAGLTRGRISIPGEPVRPYSRFPTFEKYYAGRIPPEEIARIRQECRSRGAPVHEALMERSGWPPVRHDGKLLMSHQDALLIGGKVQAPAGYADHVVFLYSSLCEICGTRICVEMCSGQAITVSPDGLPQFDREKCVHCGACLWNCYQPLEEDPEKTNIEFRAGAGGLHSTQN
jgi:electron-transferring-flavoprotein dehydrogenase